MSLIAIGCRSVPDCPPINGTPGPIGPPGPMGPQGIPGIDGLNAFGITIANFTMPPVWQTVVVSVNPAQWATPTQIIYIMSTGYFQVASVSSLLEMELINLGVESVAPGTIVPAGLQVSPAGPQGFPGRNGTKWFLGSGSPINIYGATQGDLYLDVATGDIYELTALVC